MNKPTISSASLKDTYTKAEKVLRRIPWILGTHAFLYAIVLLVLAICLGEFLFYNDVYLAKMGNPDDLMLPVRFNEQTYQAVIKDWQDRQAIFTGGTGKTYSNPF